ncbi:MAG: sugar phosphate nucleotidyltransferase [Candidatus Marinimicrobia bacterium]|jgi:mannose-1-phosphate guanylyltransferase|nr:sugar phosphate nucleotidyltransferase [Candidatus Neomarinimicrobiota bacterium]MDP6611373.1 sugar phosphate nucleotidyltransferase [Candidatus Neomarinimicrobiota bacterium]|tara:strand:- start:17646 stop:18689 length:1044 start_codon:yes stop_codon:yes gene_type:complete
MAGGRGTRFWPSSRKENPKQLLKIVGNEPMLQMTVDRLKKMKNMEDIFIVAGPDLAPKIRKMIKGVKPKNIIIEPSGKSTAPAIGLAALHIKKLREDAVIGVFPADHIIVGAQKFAKAVRSAIQLANKNGSLVTIGIEPTYASTGYGYIQYDHNSPEDHLNGFKVKTFAEKPHPALAERFLESGDFLWNGGMFVWKIDTFFDKIAKHMPDLSDQLGKIEKRIAKKQDFTRLWNNIETESIDYGLMEKSSEIYVVKAEFEWNDIGSWESVYDVSPKSKGKNVIRGEGVVLEGQNNLIQSNGHFTAVIGADNLVVVNTEDATLVVPRAKVEDVKALVNYLEKKKRNDLL